MAPELWKGVTKGTEGICGLIVIENFTTVAIVHVVQLHVLALELLS